MIRKIIVSLILIALVLGAGVGAAWFFIENRQSPPTRDVKPMIPRVEAPPLAAVHDYPVQVVGYGTARPKVQLEITPQVGGEIDYRSEAFLSGKRVEGPRDGRPGEVLFRIDSERYQLAAEDAKQQIAIRRTRLKSLDAEEANLKKLQNIAREQLTLDNKELERFQQLLKEGASTESEVEQAMSRLLATRRSLQDIENQLALIPERRAELEAEIAAARIKLLQAELDLKYATYRVPVTGRIISSNIDKGDYVQPGEVCGEMYGTDEMELPVSILASDLRWINREAVEGGGLPAEVTWAEPGTGETHTWQGQVQRIEAGLEAQTRMARLVVVVDNTAQAQASPEAPLMLDINMYCRVAIGGKTVEKAFLIPRRAIVNGSSVYVAVPDTEQGYQLSERKIRIARYADGQAMVLPGGGLEAGDRVILSAVPKPVEGMSLQVERADAPGANESDESASNDASASP
jgi:multidrug efflux pump subunit AcrA (membrane-fusion protein)